MKKLLNDPYAYASETLEGLCRAHPQYYRFSEESRQVVVRPDSSVSGKVGIVTGGGSGHLPVFVGYVGQGLLNACAVGDVFASPSADDMAIAMRAADGGAGVLRLYGNYGGDVMNFDMAGELVELDGIASTTVLVADDVASASKEERKKRRGVAGMVYCFKMAGAAAAEGSDLAGVTRIAQKAAEACHSMGIALGPCIVPQAGKPTFTIGEDEMEIGMGIHGEPGVSVGKLESANSVADTLVDRIVADGDFSGEVSVLVNSLGATPLEELYILYARIADRLEGMGLTIVMPLVGRYATSMEMSGASVTIVQLDDELKRLLAAPAECAFWRV
ncbi:MAG: dihydroxyacetone kinase subunit DhaK [Bauldia sp.]|nr:dihydroxyacetone kinase subunit DhaK [Bauldia sp.]